MESGLMGAWWNWFPLDASPVTYDLIICVVMMLQLRRVLQKQRRSVSWFRILGILPIMMSNVGAQSGVYDHIRL